ncbi:MAG TPA: hypothetical protein VJ353_04965 [Xanthobacteraceae bacterium]|nr:hypothetical protein [Xanthobacteraceae bacterium]
MHGLGVWPAAFFEHRPNQVDPAARRIVLVTEKNVGRTGRGAKTVMHAGLQDAVGLGDFRLRELFGREGGLQMMARISAGRLTLMAASRRRVVRSHARLQKLSGVANLSTNLPTR